MSPPEAQAVAIGPAEIPPQAAMSAADLKAAREAALTGACVRFNVTDIGNGQRFALRYGARVKYCHARKMWYLNDGVRWKPDLVRAVRELAKVTAVAINGEVVIEPNDTRRRQIQTWARDSEGEARLNAMLSMASSDLSISITPDELDPDPNLFNCQNGTLELDTLTFRPHDSADLLTKVAGVAYNPDAECPKWKEHLELIFNKDETYIKSIQELLGYSLLNGNPLQIFPIWWGGGQNGKSVTISTVRSIMGDYAVSAAADVFMVRKSDGGPRPDVLALRGSRLVVAVESEKGHRLNEAFIKQTTGGDEYSGRGLFSNVIETFKPSHLAILITNPLPIVTGLEEAIWRRLQFWPFAVTIPKEKRIADYEKVLLAEAEGIFAWMIEGLRRYYEQGNTITIPPSVVAATAQHKSDMDILAPFFREQCVRAPDARVDRIALYDRYMVWCEETGEEVLSKRGFANALKERQITDGGKVSGRRLWLGIRFKTPEEYKADEAAGSSQEGLRT